MRSPGVVPQAETIKVPASTAGKAAIRSVDFLNIFLSLFGYREKTFEIRERRKRGRGATR